MPKKNPWISFLKKNSGKGKTMKQLSKQYSGCGLSGGRLSGGRKSGGAADAKGALASLLKGLNVKIN